MREAAYKAASQVRQAWHAQWSMIVQKRRRYKRAVYDAKRNWAEERKQQRLSRNEEQSPLLMLGLDVINMVLMAVTPYRSAKKVCT